MNIDLRDPEQVIATLRRGAEANSDAACRRGAMDVVDARKDDVRLVLTGDLHDQPVHLRAVARLAGLMGDADEPEGGGGARTNERGPAALRPAHVTLHEVIHSERLMNGLDFSYRMLVNLADLKSRHPEHVHTLLANHELSQIAGAGIVKDGVNVVGAFNDGVEYVFGGDAPGVTDAINGFIRSMPLALRVATDGGDLLCAHSLPGDDLLDRFDPGVLEREVEEADYAPRRGSAHLLVWGRDHSSALLEQLARRWGVRGFVLGHEKADEGWFFRAPHCLVLNSDHAHGVVVQVGSADLNAAAVGAGGWTETFWRDRVQRLSGLTQA